MGGGGSCKTRLCALSMLVLSYATCRIPSNASPAMRMLPTLQAIPLMSRLINYSLPAAWPMQIEWAPSPLTTFNYLKLHLTTILLVVRLAITCVSPNYPWQSELALWPAVVRMRPSRQPHDRRPHPLGVRDLAGQWQLAPIALHRQSPPKGRIAARTPKDIGGILSLE